MTMRGSFIHRNPPDQAQYTLGMLFLDGTGSARDLHKMLKVALGDPLGLEVCSKICGKLRCGAKPSATCSAPPVNRSRSECSSKAEVCGAAGLCGGVRLVRP